MQETERECAKTAWRYWPEIDGLRAVAVLGVLLFHFNHRLFPGGFVGVDIFFVISGYLITSILLADLNQNSFSIAKFYQRRIARIAPAFFVVLIATLVVASIIYSAQDFAAAGASAFSAALSVINIKLVFENGGYFNSSPDAQPLLHYWSLSVEEQFYILYPALFYISTRFLRRPLLLFVGLTLASLALSIFLTWKAPILAFYLLPPRAWELLVGCSLALWRTHGGEISARYARLTAIGGLGLIALSLLAVREGPWFPGFLSIVPVSGTALIISSLAGRARQPLAILAHPWAVFVGQISYSLYLWHWPIFSFVDYQFFLEGAWVRAVLKVSLTLFGASGTFFLIERPARKVLNRPDFRVFSFIGFAAVAFMVALSGSYVRSKYYLAANPASIARGGIVVRGGPRVVVLVGDSQAAMYARDLAIIAQKDRFTLYILAAAGGEELPNGPNSKWPDVLAFLKRTHADVVVISELWSQKLSDQPSKLANALAQLQRVAQRIVLTTEQPLLPPLASHEGVRGGARPPFFEARVDQTNRRTANEIVSALASSQVQVIDVDRDFHLPDGSIRVISNGQFVFHDRTHLASAGSILIRPALEQAIAQALSQQDSSAISPPNSTGSRSN